MAQPIRTLIALITLGTVAPSCSGYSTAPDDSIDLPRRDGSVGTEDASTPPCDITAPENCGRCGNACPTGPRGRAACVGGSCALECDVGWGDCNGDARDGCETNLETTVDHCGACDRDCRTCGGASSMCAAGLCDGPATPATVGQIALLAHDDTRVVYADASGVTQMMKDTGAFANVLEVPNARGLLVRDNVFLIYPGSESYSGIYSTYAGFVGPQIAAYARGLDVEAMALDSTGIYYAVTIGNRVSKVVRCNNCSVPSDLAPNENEVRTNGIALDTESVFFGAGDAIRKVSKTGAGLATVAVGQEPRSLAVDDAHVYWLNEPPLALPGQDAGALRGEVARVEKAGGASTKVDKLVTGLVKPLFLIASGPYLYVSDYGTGRDGVVFRIGKDGSGRVDLARGVASLGGLTVDRTCAWFSSGGTIRRVSR